MRLECVCVLNLVMRWSYWSKVPFTNNVTAGHSLPLFDPWWLFGGKVTAEAAVKALGALEPTLLGLP